MGKVPWGYRRAVLSDLSPSASFIAAGLNLPVDADAFDKASKDILDRFDAELGWMYETTHTNGKPARIEYTVWSEVFTCPECGTAVRKPAGERIVELLTGGGVRTLRLHSTV